MKARISHLLAGCLAVPLLAVYPAAFAQDSQRYQEAQYAPSSAFSAQELDQMLAPIALYPDSLLTQILMASTYPLEVVQAARWSRTNPGYRGDQAVRAVEQQNWDPSVKSLVAFPQVLELMEGSLDWTERLGNAFLSQQPEVWDTVQNLRQRADAAGNLQSNDQWRVEQDGPTYIIESPRPDIIYVPYYDPLIVYGDWWWPGYAPMRWSPWPGYHSRPGFGRGYYWGSGISIGSGFFFGGIDWRQRHVNVINRNSFYYRNVNRRPLPGNGWQHDPDHRRGVPYRNPVLRQQFDRNPATPDSRRDFRGRTPGPDRRGDPRAPEQLRPPVAPAVSAAPSPPIGASTRPAFGAGARQAPNAPPEAGRTGRNRDEQRPQALEGVGRGQEARNASARGQASTPRPPAAMPQRPASNPPPSPQPQPQRSAPSPAPARQQAAPQPSREQQAPNPPNAPRQRGEQQK
jgi:hypothetical protein